MIDTVAWRVSPGLTPYADAIAAMTARAEAVALGTQPELVWLLQHPPVYTAGTSADPAELIDPRFPVHHTGRGGRYTYHGPGQRVGYLMLDLNARGRDVRHFVHSLERWLIAALATLGINGFTVADRVGIWTKYGAVEAKIGAIGVRVKRWTTLHGFSLNLDPELSHFGGIIPCGLKQFGVTSVRQLGFSTDFMTLDAALEAEFGGFLASLEARHQNEA